MKVLLVNPPQWMAYGTPVPPVYPPLGLLQLASCLESDGHEVYLVDADADGLSIFEVIRWVRQHRPDLVGFTATTPSFPTARQWAARIRSTASCLLLIGGPHASALPEEVLGTSCFDYLFQGEADQSLCQAVAALDRGETEPQIPGLWTKATITPEPPRLLTEDELNNLPPPAWHLVQHPDRYRPPDAGSLPVGTIAVTRGCPGRCRFCQAPLLFGRRVRYLRAEKVLADVAHVTNSLGAKEVHFVDDCFTATPSKAGEICRRLADSGPPVSYAFGNGVRVDTLDRDMLQHLHAMGVRSLGLGIETASREIAEAAGKEIDYLQARSTLAEARQMGFSTWAFFMLGLPGETVETLQRTSEFARSLPLDVAKFEIFKPYPGTELYEQLSSRGRIKKNGWQHWGIHTSPVHTLPGLAPRDILRARRKAVLRFFARPRMLASIVRGRPNKRRILLNFHAVKFLAKSLVACR